MTPEILKQIILDQMEEDVLPEDYIFRAYEQRLETLTDNREIIVLLGIRRCGKSVLLHRIRQHNKESDYYFNFEDERLARFKAEDFQTLQKVFIELFGQQKSYYFDEIQNISGWEMFVRRLYNSGNKIYITGSNANLFSDELGTRLTGRYIALKVYPISFIEFLKYKNPDLASIPVFSTTQMGKVKQIFNQYCEQGSIPEYIKHSNMDYLHSLYDSIIYRDIIARYKITNERALRELIYFLASNCSKEITYNSLRKFLGLGSTTTIIDYCNHLQKSFLCYFVNRYSDSLKTQQQSPKKIYFADHVLAKTIGFRFSNDQGRMLENIVFIELARRNVEIFYHNEKKECDFITRKSNQMLDVIQVCHSLEGLGTKQREVDGLLEACRRFSLKRGYILTDNEESNEIIEIDGLSIEVIITPVWKWLLENHSG